MVKLCEKCGGIMNYDPYFKADVCNGCGAMQRILKNETQKQKAVYEFHSKGHIVTNMESRVFSYSNENCTKYIVAGR